MELFVVNRYVGDEPISESAVKEEELQKVFLEKINERKKLNQLSVKEQNNLKNKILKITHEENELTNIENIDFNTLGSEDVKKKKKLKSKDKSKEKEILEDQEETEVKKIKTKKRKVDHANIEVKNNECEVDKEEIEEKNINENDKSENAFLILGQVQVSKADKKKTKLPNWLANPSVVSVDLKNLTCKVDSVPELDKIFLNLLKENNITHFFPVQSQIIPWLLRNRNRPNIYWHNDICVSAPTGSGKTLAFVLPILQCLYKRIVPKIRALVVLPVQELALQVYNVFKTYSKGTDLNILLFSKRVPFEEEQSLICKNDGTGKYTTLVDIIITTPGRLVDHLTKTKGLCLDSLTYLVIDEADRVMEHIQNDWLYHLNKRLTTECTRSYQVPFISYSNMTKKKKLPHKLLFSATLSQDPEKLQQLGLFQPKLFTSVVKSNNDVRPQTQFVGKYTTPAELTEYFVTCTKINKPLILNHLISTESWKNVLCFVNSAKATSRLAFVLKSLCNRNIKITRLAANLTIKKRNLVLKEFSNGKIDVLISSDALARGIDIPNVQYVISYDAPKYIKTYIHRIGRTGRAGKKGTSIVLLTKKEINSFQKMIESSGKTSVEKFNIDEEKLSQYEEAYETALKSLQILLEKKQQRKLLKTKTQKISKLRASKGKLFRVNQYHKINCEKT